jgi:hypothetical protein
MDWKWHAGALPEALNERVKTLGRHWAAALRSKHVRARRLLALKTAQGADLVTSNRMDARRSALAAADVQTAGRELNLVPLKIAQLAGPARCLLDLLGPAGRCSARWPHDGAVAGGADSTLVIFRFGATMELGRSERTTMRPHRAHGGRRRTIRLSSLPRNRGCARRGQGSWRPRRRRASAPTPGFHMWAGAVHDGDHEWRAHQTLALRVDMFRPRVRVLGAKCSGDCLAGRTPSVAFKHDKAPRCELAMIRHASSDGQERVDFGCGWGRAGEFDGFEGAPGSEELKGVGHGPGDHPCC